MDLSQKQRWGEIRSKGCGRYVLMHGFLGKAVPLIVCFVIAHFLSRRLFASAIPVMFWFVLTPLALAWGVISSGLAWSKNEERYDG